MYSTPFSGQLEGISTSQPISQTVGFVGMVGYQIQNVTPAHFKVQDENNVTIKLIPPWSEVQGSFNPTTRLSIQADYSLPVIPAVGISAAAYQFTLSTSPIAFPEQSTTLSVANAVSSMVLNSSGQAVIAIADGQTIQVASGTVNVGNSPTVSVSSGSIDITNNPNVTVSNNEINVTPTAGSRIEIANTIQAEITGSTTINTKTVNDYISNNTAVAFGTIGVPVSNLANGGIISYLNLGSANLTGFYDGFMITASSSVFLSTKISNSYQLSTTQTGAYQVSGNLFSFVDDQAILTVKNNGVLGCYIGYFPTAEIFSHISLQLTNISGSTIVTDTVTLTAWALKAQVTVNNDTSSPVNTQGVHGSPTASGYVNLNIANGWNYSFTSLANLVVTKLIISAQWQGSATATNDTAILVTSNNLSGYIAFFPFTGTIPTGFIDPFTIDLGEGIVLGSNGVNVYLLGATDNIQISLFATLK